MPDPIQLETVSLDIHANGNKQIFKQFARCLSPSVQCDYNGLIDTLNHLQSNNTASVGDGIQIFHGWVDGWPKSTISFMRLKTPYETDTPDRVPVDTVLLLLSPTKEGTKHLSTLSRLTRFIKDPHHLNVIRGTNTSDAVKAIFTDTQPQSRAA